MKAYRVIPYIFVLLSLVTSNIAYAKESTIKVSHLTKNCDALLNSNIIDYTLCQNWTLDEKAVTDIWKYKEKAKIFNPVHELSPTQIRVYYESNITTEGVNFELNIYTTSWLSLYNPKNKKTIYYSCRKKQCEKYFLGNFVTEGILLENEDIDLEEKLNNNVDKIKQKLGMQQISSKWIKTYHLSPLNALNIDTNKCEITSNNDTDVFSCYAFENNNSLYVYSDILNDSHVYLIYLDKKVGFNDGDFILKINSDDITMNYRLNN